MQKSEGASMPLLRSDGLETRPARRKRAEWRGAAAVLLIASMEGASAWGQPWEPGTTTENIHYDRGNVGIGMTMPGAKANWRPIGLTR